MTDIFTSETTTAPKLEDFVGEGKKYIDGAAAAKALVEKDLFIQRLQDEARRKEEDLQKALNVQAFEDRMKALETAQLAERTAPSVPEATAPQTAQIDEDAIQRAIERREQANTRSRNLIDVNEKMVSLFGDQAPTRVKARAAELNMSMARLNELAAESPSAFYAMIGLDTAPKAPDNITPPATQRNSAAFTPTGTVKNNAYFQNLRKTNPSAYWTVAVQNDEWNELRRQGPEAFGL